MWTVLELQPSESGILAILMLNKNWVWSCPRAPGPWVLGYHPCPRTSSVMGERGLMMLSRAFSGNYGLWAQC